MGGKLVKAPPERVNFDNILAYLKIDPTELDAAIENNRQGMPIWKRAVTYHFFQLYLTRSTVTKYPYRPNPSGFDPSVTSYSMLELVKQDTAKWQCSIAELALAMQQCAKSRKLARYPSLSVKPTHFLSYCWAFPLTDIYGETMSITKTSGPDWGLWIDILTINQHQGDKTAEDLRNLDKVIEEIGNVVFVVDAKGTAMTRVWCLYELMTAVRCGAKITAVFMGEGRSAYDAAIIALAVLAGRFDSVDVRDSQATVASDKALILGQVAENPGLDKLNETIRTTLKKCAQAEFDKERMNFGSVWWSGPKHFPPWLLKSLVDMIQKASAALHSAGGGGSDDNDNANAETETDANANANANTKPSDSSSASGDTRTSSSQNPCAALLVSAEEEARALKAAVESGEAVGKDLNWWRPKPRNSLDKDSPLYKKLETILNIVTWGTRSKPLVDWDDLCQRVEEAQAAAKVKAEEDAKIEAKKAAKKKRKEAARARKAAATSGGGGGGGEVNLESRGDNANADANANGEDQGEDSSDKAVLAMLGSDFDSDSDSDSDDSSNSFRFNIVGVGGSGSDSEHSENSICDSKYSISPSESEDENDDDDTENDGFLRIMMAMRAQLEAHSDSDGDSNGDDDNDGDDDDDDDDDDVSRGNINASDGDDSDAESGEGNAQRALADVPDPVDNGEPNGEPAGTHHEPV